MSWPQSTEYNAAIQNLRSSVSDDELRGGEPVVNALGIPIPFSGNFADVYKVYCPKTGNTWAVKCFTRETPGLRDRYRQISEHLRRARLPFTVGFEFVEPGIRIRREWYPFLKMQWVEGLALNDFVEKYVDNPKTLRQLLGLWVKLAARLRRAEMAHADLQHGNVLLVPMPRGQLALKLIDYDGMYVPALSGRRTGELGHPCYQHPQRLREGVYSAEVDRFSHLAIYCAVRSLAAGGRSLWERFRPEENLLFREPDFASPADSEVFHTLCESREADVRALAGRLALACQRPLDQSPLLDEIMHKGTVLPLRPTEESALSSLLSAGKAAVRGGGGAAASGVQPAGSAPASLDASAATIGTMPARGSGTVPAGEAPWWQAGSAPAPAEEPPPLPTRPKRPTTLDAAAMLRLGIRGVAAGPRALDSLFATFFGKDNALVNHFFTGLTLVALVVLGGFGLKLAGPKSGKSSDPAEYVLEVDPPETEIEALGESVTLVGTGARRTLTCAAPDGSRKVTIRATAAGYAPLTQDIQPQPGESRRLVLRLYEREITLELRGGVVMHLVLIPPGSFTMGDADGSADERPVHKVNITEAFYLGKYEVTQEQWQAVMRENPAQFEDPNSPVEQVSWKDCQAFVACLNSRARGAGFKGRFRLPTEAEWEHACRAGSTTRYCFGDDENGLYEYGWYSDNAQDRTHPVGEKKPNAWGLHDMHGNVWEWCADWYDSDYYEGSPTDDPKGPATGSYRVFRGGSFRAGSCRSAIRFWSRPDFRDDYSGLRVACSVDASGSATPETAKPATYEVTVDPPEANVVVTGNGALIEGTGATRTLRVAEPDGKEQVLVTARLPGYEPSEEQLQPRPGESGRIEFHLKPTPPAEPLQPGREVITNSIGMKLKLIPAGEFSMGSPESEEGRSSDEGPQHRVRITRPFYLGVHEVTQTEYERMMGNNPSHFKAASLPVENASWDDAIEFCRKLSALPEERSAGRVYRLPTEAEWEYACRAGSTTQYCFGDDENGLDEYGWFSNNSQSRTHPAGGKNANAWGLCDMHGNVWEWCADWYGRDFYGNSPTDDPTGPASGSLRVDRGGGWDGVAGSCRSASRDGYWPVSRYIVLGFRVALVGAE